MAMRMAVVAPSYFAKRSPPKKPQDLTEHKPFVIKWTHGSTDSPAGWCHSRAPPLLRLLNGRTNFNGSISNGRGREEQAMKKYDETALRKVAREIREEAAYQLRGFPKEELRRQVH